MFNRHTLVLLAPFCMVHRPHHSLYCPYRHQNKWALPEPQYPSSNAQNFQSQGTSTFSQISHEQGCFRSISRMGCTMLGCTEGLFLQLLFWACFPGLYEPSTAPELFVVCMSNEPKDPLGPLAGMPEYPRRWKIGSRLTVYLAWMWRRKFQSQWFQPRWNVYLVTT